MVGGEWIPLISYPKPRPAQALIDSSPPRPAGRPAARPRQAFAPVCSDQSACQTNIMHDVRQPQETLAMHLLASVCTHLVERGIRPAG